MGRGRREMVVGREDLHGSYKSESDLMMVKLHFSHELGRNAYNKDLSASKVVYRV